MHTGTRYIVCDRESMAKIIRDYRARYGTRSIVHATRTEVARALVNSEACSSPYLR